MCPFRKNNAQRAVSIVAAAEVGGEDAEGFAVFRDGAAGDFDVFFLQ